MNYFCSKPFASMQIHDQGDVAPCCIWKDDKVNNKAETFDTYFTSDQIKDVQEKLINNQPPHQCMPCYDQEKRSGHSLRTISEEFESLEPQIRSQGIYAISNVYLVVDLVTYEKLNYKKWACLHMLQKCAPLILMPHYTI